jgi:hypothetical protein
MSPKYRENDEPLPVDAGVPGAHSAAEAPEGVAIPVDDTSVSRVVLLGASNLTLAFPSLLETLDARQTGRSEIFAALGHGRSYGTWSRVLFRALPSITKCELWRDLARADRTAAATRALVTDVGNDLLYGASPAQIAGWVEECLARLGSLNAQIVLMLLPLASVERLSALRYNLTRTLFFPGRRLSQSDMLSRARDLNARLAELGRAHGTLLVEQPLDWFGFDPIHIRATRRADAWRQIISHWAGYGDLATIARPTLHRRWRALTVRPAERRLLGRLQRTPQPALTLSQSSVYVY